MVRFLVQVLVAFAFWACVVWFGLPILKEQSPSVYGRLSEVVINDTIGHTISEAVDTVEHNVKAIAENPPQISLSDLKPDVSSGEPPEEKSGGEMGSETNVQEHLTTQDENSPVVENAEAIPEDALAALNKDPGYGWGIVVTNSYFYDSTMKRIGIMTGGTVVERKQSLIKVDGYVAECFYIVNRSWQYDTVYIYESDLVLFEGPYRNAEINQRNLLIEYCRTKGKLEELRVNAYKEAIRRNPHYEQYKAVTEEYKAFVQNAKAVKEEFDNASDVRRSVLMDQLRKLQGEETSIKQRYTAIKGQYDAWKTANIGEDKTPRITKTVEIQNLENKLNSMKSAVQEIVPGL